MRFVEPRSRTTSPRLVRTTQAVRVHLVVTVVCGVAVTGLILLQAYLVARAIANAPLLNPDGTWVDVGGAVALVGVVALLRAGLAYGAETAALRSAAAVKSQLRRRLVAHVTGPGADPASLDPGELATLATRGLDALERVAGFTRLNPNLCKVVCRNGYPQEFPCRCPANNPGEPGNP